MWREAEVLPCKRDFKNKMKKIIIKDLRRQKTISYK